MKTHLTAGLIAILGTAAAAQAQTQGTVTYSIRFTSNAPGTIGSGTNAIQVPLGATVQAWVWGSFDPGVGAPTPQGPVCCLSDGSFSLTGEGDPGLGDWGPNSHQGTFGALQGTNNQLPLQFNWLNTMNRGLNNGYHVGGVTWATGPLYTVPPPMINPDDVWSGVFTASSVRTGTVHFTFTWLPPTGIWTGPQVPTFSVIYASDPGPGGSITVAGCYPDCNTSGSLSVSDFLCFQNTFLAGAPHADCDSSTVLTVADFVCFQGAFVAGCP